VRYCGVSSRCRSYKGIKRLTSRFGGLAFRDEELEAPAAIRINERGGKSAINRRWEKLKEYYKVKGDQATRGTKRST